MTDSAREAEEIEAEAAGDEAEAVEDPGPDARSGVEPEVGSPAVAQPVTRIEARRVRRVLRRIDPWSVFKVAFVFAICMYGIVVISSLLIWRAADSAGVVDNLEDFVVSVGFSDFNVDPAQLFNALVVGGGLMIVVSTVFALLGSILFNLICDMVGGVKLSMIEERIVEDG